MPDSKSKTAWEAENVIQVKVKVNRNQDPELYELLTKAPSKSGLARDMMNQAIRKNGELIKEENMENYYVTAVVTRPMTSSEGNHIAVAGRIYKGRCKTVVQADSPEEAIAAGAEIIRTSLDGSGLRASDFGCISVAWAEKLGDTGIYDVYQSPEAFR